MIPARAKEFSVEIDGLLFDFSKHKITSETLRLLVELARARHFEARREALFSGKSVNNTEGRAAMHMALRDLSGKPIGIGGVDVRPDIEREREKVLSFARAVRTGAAKPAKGERFTDVVNIGIGGSDLGPAMACRALSPYRGEGPRTHFVANVDGADLADTLSPLDLSRTLFIVSSKTFTTQETMANAASARARVVEALGEAAVAQPFRRRLDEARQGRRIRHRGGSRLRLLGLGRRALFTLVGDRLGARHRRRPRTFHRLSARRLRRGRTFSHGAD